MENNKFIIQNCYPATVWQDATPLGNGRVGAMMYGCLYDERILVNHESLYGNMAEKELPDISKNLPKLRELLAEKKYKEANTFYPEILKDAGYFSNTGEYLPAFDIHLVSQTRKDFKNYVRKLDIRQGIASVSWEDDGISFLRECFVSMDNGLIFLKLSASTNCLNFEIKIEPHDLADAINYQGDKLTTLPKTEFTVVNNVLTAYLQTAENRRFCMQMHLFGDGDIELFNCKNRKMLNDMQGTVRFDSNFYSVKNASQITVVCSLKEQSEDLPTDLAQVDYEKCKNAHTKLFSKIFDSMKLDLGVKDSNRPVEYELLDSYNGEVGLPMIERMANFGRYLLISSSYRSKYPANLQGIWNGNYSPAWASTFFNNENIEMNYWQSFVGNLGETILPLFDLYLSKMDDFKENAKKLYGCRGILLPLYMDAYSGTKKCLLPHVVYWTASSSWIANMFYDYFLFTRDKTFLREKAYPFMREAANFYEDFMVIGEDGYLKSYPSNSPENCAIGDFEGSENVSVCMNATMDFSALKQLLLDLIETVKHLGIVDEKEKIWQDMLNRIPPYKVNQDGALTEWLHPDFRDNYAHRHLSHLYALFPGREIDCKHDLRDACRKALELRLKNGLKEQTGWSFAHMANIFARLGDGDNALRCLELLVRFCTGNNLFTYHNDWRNQGVTLKFVWANHAPFQIDANLGFTSAVQEMLLFSTERCLRILPALPSSWRNVSVESALTRCGVEASFYITDDKVDIKLVARIDTEFVLDCGRPIKFYSQDGKLIGKNASVKLNAGDELALSGVLENFNK